MSTGFIEMFRYNAWANHQLFQACRTLTDEQLDFHRSGVSGSVAELLLHLAGGQQTDILRTQGRQHEGELTRYSDWPGIEAAIEIADRTSAELTEIAGRLRDEEQVDLP